MRLLLMILLLPFTFLAALWHSLVLFVQVFRVVWKMLKNLNKERYL